MAKPRAKSRKPAAKAHTLATVFSVLTLLLVVGFFAQNALEIVQGDVLSVLAERLSQMVG